MPKKTIRLDTKTITESTQKIFDILKHPNEADELDVIVPSLISDIPTTGSTINFSAHLPGHSSYKVKELPIEELEQAVATSRRTYQVYDPELRRCYPYTDYTFRYHYTDATWAAPEQTYKLYPNQPLATDSTSVQLQRNQTTYMRDLVVCPIGKAGYGLFLDKEADSAIPKQTPIIAYSGFYTSKLTITSNELLGHDHYVIGGRDTAYRFSDAVDAFRAGNIASFINYGPTVVKFSSRAKQVDKKRIAKANVEYKVTTDSFGRSIYYIKTRKTIKPGQQLLADYGYTLPEFMFFSKDNSSLVNKWNGDIVALNNGPSSLIQA